VLERLRNWLRTPSQTPSEPPAAPPGTPADESLHALVQQLAERIAAIEAWESQIQLAWQETLDKLGRWASKQAARERRRVDRDLDQLAQDGPETHEDAPGSTNGGGSDLQVGGMDRAAVKAQLRARAATLFRRG
jgi:hypothetical protein